MLAEAELTLGQGQPIARQAAGDREQHREATPHRLGRVEKALQIEVDNLMARAAPAADQAAALGHNPQQVTCGRIAEFPVGIGRLALNQGHAFSFLVWDGHQSA